MTELLMKSGKEPEITAQERIYTEDTLFDGELVCRQHRNGYRFSLDAVLAAHFHPPAKGSDVLDLGAGCGIIGLIILYRWGHKIGDVKGVEFQPQLQKLADMNYNLNGFSPRGKCILGDVKNILDFLPPESFSQVICNPPFYQSNSGRQNVCAESRLARHQSAGTLDHFTTAAGAVVKNGGVVVFVYPAEQLAELIIALKGARLELKSLQFVYSYPDPVREAQLVLVKCIKNGGRGAQVLSPFYVYTKKNGQYTSEMSELYKLNSTL